MKKSVVWFIMLGIGFTLLLFPTASSFAEKISPPRIYMVIQRGKIGKAVLTLRGTELNEKVLLYLTDVTIDRRGNYQFEEIEDWKYSAMDRIKLRKVRLVAKETPEEEAKIRVIAPLYEKREILTLKMSADTYIGLEVRAPYKSGEYYAGIIVEPSEPEILRGLVDGEAIEVQRIRRFGIPITITVPGRAPRLGGEIIETSSEIGEDQIKIFVTFENTGGMLEYVKGKVSIINKENKRVYDDPVLKALVPLSPDGTGEIYPEGIRDFEAEVSRPLPAGEYDLRTVFEIKTSLAPDAKVQKKIRKTTSFTIPETVAMKQRELLTLVAETQLLQFNLKSGGLVMSALEITNQDFQPLSVDISIPKGAEKWLQITENLNLRASQPGRPVSKKIRFKIRIPRDENAERNCKITFTPERGKPVVVDLMIGGQ